MMAAETETCFYGSTANTDIAEEQLAGSIGILDAFSNTAMGESPHRLSDVSVLSLDGYGTLVDRESGVVSALMPWLRDVGVMAGRSEIIRAFLQAERESFAPGMSYRSVLVCVHDALADFFGVAPDRKAAEEFAASTRHWPIYPDAPKALAYLKQHFQLVVLTNVDHAVFDVTNEALGVEFDAVYTAEDSGTHKPNAKAFSYLLSRLEEAGIEKRRVLHVAGSIRCDHVPAQHAGMSTCWIYRQQEAERLAKAQKHGLDFCPDFQFRTLGGLADAHWAEIRGGRAA